MLAKLRAKVKIYQEKGFSLVEVSIILMIAGLLISGYVTWIAPAAKSNAFKFIETQQKIQDINDAVEKFVSLNGRLPCPASSTIAWGAISGTMLYSSENLSGTNCSSNVGAVPTAVLGLSPDMMLDAWGRKFTYVTASGLCGTGGCTSSTYNNGAATLLNIKDITMPVGVDISTTGAYLVMSHGPSGRGAFRQSGSQQTGCTTVEAENCDTTTNNVYRMGAVSNNFQHLVFYRNKADLDNLLVDPNAKLIDLQTCLDNSTQLALVTQANAVTNPTSLRNVILNTTISLVRNNANGDSRTQTYNRGDEAALDVLWHLQEACYILYPTQMPATKSCPGGGTYNATENACTCANGTWNGSC
ncbi:MAG: hypothetical protein J0G32_05290 [Alphaproteobacteria bacterium]|nr:hypothetical protein [Alphaproteobacteria bacterium]OJV16005.1 MAG: hypothetical protein BGO27_04065 [Alphaproteobacteria bacterium 33-17]